MTAAFGLGMPGIAIFHLMTHAFFKALMFLGSGSDHTCHHEQDIFNYGGLRKKMPITALTFLVGVLAISGVNFLSGYFSKDAILLGAYNSNMLFCDSVFRSDSYGSVYVQALLHYL